LGSLRVSGEGASDAGADDDVTAEDAERMGD